MNYRHKMAQHAGRASVNLHTQVNVSTTLFDILLSSPDQSYTTAYNKLSFVVLLSSTATFYISD